MTERLAGHSLHIKPGGQHKTQPKNPRPQDVRGKNGSQERAILAQRQCILRFHPHIGFHR